MRRAVARDVNAGLGVQRAPRGRYHAVMAQSMAYQQPPSPVAYPPCQSCGRSAPTKQVTLMQNVGLLIMRFPRTLRGRLCKACISKHFWEMTTITFFFGWWGIISFFYSLYSIPQNI